MTITPPGGRTHGDEHHVGLADRSGKISRESQATRLHIARDQIGKAWLINRYAAALQ